MKRLRHLALAAGLGALALSGCSTGSTESGGDAATSTTKADADAYPVTIEHALGKTTIEEEPTRVATLGWADQDVAVSLGVVPVGATKLTWGGNEAGSSEWFDAAVEELGGEAPVRYDDADGAPIDEVAQLRPDLILATNSGITEQEYAKLSKIAPVVAYPEAPWTTPWQSSLETVGQALGRTDEAEKVAAEAEQQIEAAKEEHPGLEGASMIFGYLATTDLSTIGIYAPQDPRVSFMHDLGLVDAPAVEEAVKPGEFYSTVSAEKAPELESDVFLTWAETPEDMTKFAEDKLVGKMPAIAGGNAYAEADKQVAMAVTNPTPLSIPFVIENFVPEVSKAVQGS
ncbi:iron-siderophore ABC transporter substrate-binding protein [Nocardioides aurantiacus]|uniref:iron-siderophore ABC transporter substrate-binding protein n=1 Tax=Nocardioides aurantiacus TaxID=86796 RepID=UPI00403F1713